LAGIFYAFGKFRQNSFYSLLLLPMEMFNLAMSGWCDFDLFYIGYKTIGNQDIMREAKLWKHVCRVEVERFHLA